MLIKDKGKSLLPGIQNSRWNLLYSICSVLNQKLIQENLMTETLYLNFIISAHKSSDSKWSQSIFDIKTFISPL